VHVQQPPGPGALVQVIDVLGDDQQFAGPFGVQSRERPVGGVRFDRVQRGAAQIVETVHQHRILRQRLGRADVLDAMPLPQPTGTTESGEPAFGGEAGAGQDDEVANGGHRASVASWRDTRQFTKRLEAVAVCD
jgi:hypothetical protein